MPLTSGACRRSGPNPLPVPAGRRHAGLTATGLDAGAGKSYGSKGAIAGVRELLARTKAVADVVTGARPTFLGPHIDIAGDARASRG